MARIGPGFSSAAPLAVTQVDGNGNYVPPGGSRGLTTLVDRSGTTSSTIGNVTTLAAANSNRQYLRINNLSNTATLYLYDKPTGTPTANNSIPIIPGSGYIFDTQVSTAAIKIAADTASVNYEAAEA